MKRISLICTVHEENGQANSAELHARLARFRPDVVFLEAPCLDLESFFRDGERRKLEAVSVRQYRDETCVPLLPVDLPTPEADFFYGHERAIQSVESKSHNFRRLMTWYRNYVYDYGFRYLNSEHNCRLWADINQDILSTVREMDDPGVSEVIEQWIRVNDMREHEMLSNIQRHCSQRSFERGVFILGAAHRSAIIEKSSATTDIEWSFSDI